MAEQKSMRDLFLDQLYDMYNAEGQLVKALPKMAKAASSEDLRAAIEEHLEQTKNQVARLDQVFEALDETPKRKSCKAMKGLIAEGDEILKEDFEADVMDAAIIAAAQKVEHYEIATYGTLCAWAEQLREERCCSLLGANLEEEKAADDKLTEIAETSVNAEAVQKG